MKKNKSWLAMCILSFAMLMVGCGKAESDDVGKTRAVNDLEITITNVAIQNSSNDDKQIAKIDFSIKNTGKEESGAGAGDFTIQTKDETKHPVYGLNANNFGSVIPAGKVLKGSGYYEIPTGQKSVTVLYEPYATATTERIAWKINVPAK
ncbi:DUF4352 domain-containing protein [Listeria booriae]|uniref:DUF4352 domain-containing protein n=1 Tax=Listeria booriae TaxID=1552123 RepID=A0A7X0XJF7_9LIST|nr:DUF4352 domain-containing protein [Listeria booriae]MBC1561636.1 DUF4352 domain-containing protein [Listeria booriae]MBC1573953.1 DUF4352 domain-containing protein [Listeria booriae]